MLILLWTTIRRIPLAPQPGHAAEVIGPAAADIDIVSSHGNLVTGGSFLYWQSDTAINKMPIRGGAVTVLDTTPLTRPATGLHLIGPNLIYAVDRIVYHVPADGSAITPPNLRVVFTVTTGVVSCAPLWDPSSWQTATVPSCGIPTAAAAKSNSSRARRSSLCTRANFLHSHGRLDW